MVKFPRGGLVGLYRTTLLNAWLTYVLVSVLKTSSDVQQFLGWEHGSLVSRVRQCDLFFPRFPLRCRVALYGPLKSVRHRA